MARNDVKDHWIPTLRAIAAAGRQGTLKVPSLRAAQALNRRGLVRYASTVMTWHLADLGRDYLLDLDAATEPGNHQAVIDRSGDTWIRVDEFGSPRGNWYPITDGPGWEEWGRNKVGTPRPWADVQEHGELTPASDSRAALALVRVRGAHDVVVDAGTAVDTWGREDRHAVGSLTFKDGAWQLSPVYTGQPGSSGYQPNADLDGTQVGAAKEWAANRLRLLGGSGEHVTDWKMRVDGDGWWFEPVWSEHDHVAWQHDITIAAHRPDGTSVEHARCAVCDIAMHRIRPVFDFRVGDDHGWTFADQALPQPAADGTGDPFTVTERFADTGHVRNTATIYGAATLDVVLRARGVPAAHRERGKADYADPDGYLIEWAPADPIPTRTPDEWALFDDPAIGLPAKVCRWGRRVAIVDTVTGEVRCDDIHPTVEQARAAYANTQWDDAAAAPRPGDVIRVHVDSHGPDPVVTVLTAELELGMVPTLVPGSWFRVAVAGATHDVARTPATIERYRFEFVTRPVPGSPVPGFRAADDAGSAGSAAPVPTPEPGDGDGDRPEPRAAAVSAVGTATVGGAEWVSFVIERRVVENGRGDWETVAAGAAPTNPASDPLSGLKSLLDGLAHTRASAAQGSRLSGALAGGVWDSVIRWPDVALAA